MKLDRFQNALVGRGFSNLRRFDGEVADLQLGRWAYLAFVLGAPLFFVIDRLTLSVRYHLAVVWVYGAAYSERHGIRYVGGRPPKFSDGSVLPVEVQILVSILPALVSGVFLAVYIAFTLKKAFACFSADATRDT